MTVPRLTRKSGRVRLICPHCGRSHSDKTTAALLRWWKAHRNLSEEDASS